MIPVKRLSHIVFGVMALAGWHVGVARAEFIYDATVPFDPRVEKAIARAQEWLAQTQQPNGSWGTCNGRNALSCMALMVNGTTPGHGRYGAKVATAVDFLVNSQHDNGYLVVGDSGNMYQHGLATLCLAEAYGMTHNIQVREALIKSIDLIVRSQNREGGWRYKPVPEDADLSVTVMQVMALRACVETGLYVPKETIDFAIRYVKGLWGESWDTFGYAGPANEASFNRAAAGTVCLQSCGLNDDTRIPRAIAHMMKHAPWPGEEGGSKRGGQWMWYGHYYASVAMYHHGGDEWKAYYPRVTAGVLKEWEKRGHYDDVLNTSWAILVLGVPYRYLPIYQE